MKNKNILLILFIFLAIFSIIIVKPISNLDEIWNYNTARAISEGLIPYKDISMITTPMLPMFTAVFLKLFANEIIVSRALSAICWTGIIFTVYKILFILIKEENFSVICTSLIAILCRGIFCIDYNVLILLLALIILYQELKDINNKNILNTNIKKNLFLGILAGIAICTKQSIGITLAGIFVIYKLAFLQDKKQFIEYIKIALIRTAGIMLPVAVVIVYLIANGALLEFINYALLGISNFSNKIPYTELLQNDKIEIQVLSVLMPISIIIMLITIISDKIVSKKSNKISEIFTMLIYSISIIIVMYPISDEIHFLIGALISILGLIYSIGILLKNIYKKITWQKKYKIYKIASSIIWIFLFTIILIHITNNYYKYIKVDKNKEIEHLKYIEIPENLSERIKIIDNYILEKEKEGKKVYILDAESAIYMLPINKYNKDYDMFLKGNIGHLGEEGQIEKIKQRKENEIYLIRRRNLEANWQTPINVINYIRENLELVGAVNMYEIYK